MKTRITATLTHDDIEAVKDGLRDYNKHFIPQNSFKELGVFIEDDAGNKTAGLIAETVGNYLMIKFLWVDESLRGQDSGTSLIRQAEEEAVARGCRHALVDTFSFQARPFYERLGYECRMTLEDFIDDIRAPEGNEASHERYFLTKRLG
ncbi:biphenyl 2,3-dioxygenase [Rouxiella silvae]|uniref:Biphenyl 2,3-dioxygenase n=1 Tax=Rouxiella silvae TaxID=1646373 RepID=A0ABX3TX54_9GAMM|nr:GNAT family N-acetyltransferase [Rouxiella silvae]ORJ19784.1 biphenyl 2,3-dioxygenase [Rouxiella silvae]